MKTLQISIRRKGQQRTKILAFLIKKKKTKNKHTASFDSGFDHCENLLDLIFLG